MKNIAVRVMVVPNALRSWGNKPEMSAGKQTISGRPAHPSIIGGSAFKRLRKVLYGQHCHSVDGQGANLLRS